MKRCNYCNSTFLSSAVGNCPNCAGNSWHELSASYGWREFYAMTTMEQGIVSKQWLKTLMTA